MPAVQANSAQKGFPRATTTTRLRFIAMPTIESRFVDSSYLNLTVPIYPISARAAASSAYSTVTDFARFLGLSTSVPRAQAV